jgi:hypothetical protein
MCAVPPTTDDAVEARRAAPITEAVAQVKKPVRRVAEERLILVHANPLGAQPAGDIATHAGCQPLDDDQPDRRHDRECRQKSTPHQPPAASGVKAEADDVVLRTGQMVWRAHCQHRITAMSESGNGQKLPVQRLQNATDDFRFPGTNAAVRH